MRKILLVIFAFLVLPPICLAQESNKFCGLHYVYDYKSDPGQTSAPAGYKPFYISHFGRHGARYCEAEYDTLMTWLSKGARAGALTDYGQDFFSRYIPFYEKVRYRKGNLTGVGKDQFRTIATRMFERFPDVFEGPTHVESVASEVPRVIMSMWSFLSALQSLDRTIDIHADASSKYIPWLHPNSDANPYAIEGRPRYNEKSDKECYEYCVKTAPWKSVAGKLFSTPDVIFSVLGTNPEAFTKALTYVVCNTYCLDEDQGCFDDLLSEQELYLSWKSIAARNFLLMARYEGSDNLLVDYAAYTLENIVECAESDIADGRTQLRLRFGQDSALLPLLVFLDLNGFGRSSSSFDEGIEIAPNYNVPMGASLQLVFYRNGAGKIIFKALLNEREASLPLEAVDGPYYSWNSFKEYYLPRIAASKKKITI